MELSTSHRLWNSTALALNHELPDFSEVLSKMYIDKCCKRYSE